MNISKRIVHILVTRSSTRTEEYKCVQHYIYVKLIVFMVQAGWPKQSNLQLFANSSNIIYTLLVFVGGTEYSSMVQCG